MVLMPIRAVELSKWMQWLMKSHIRRYHQHYGTIGHVCQGRFKSFIIQKDQYCPKYRLFKKPNLDKSDKRIVIYYNSGTEVC